MNMLTLVNSSFHPWIENVIHYNLYSPGKNNDDNKSSIFDDTFSIKLSVHGMFETEKELFRCMFWLCDMFKELVFIFKYFPIK